MLDELLINGSEVSRAVLNKTLLQYLKPAEKKGVAKVFYYMIKKYRAKGLIRDNGYPAEIHPVNVARTLDYNSHLMKVGLLHDIAEEFAGDEPKILNEIKKLFGIEVMKAVEQLTNHPINPNLKKKDYSKYLKQITMPDALIVKQADVLDNVRTSYSRKLIVQKEKLPEKVHAFLQHIAKIKPKNDILYEAAFYKYYAKIIEEIFRTYERQLKNILEQHKAYTSDILQFESLLVFYYRKYSTTRKQIYKKFIDLMMSNNKDINYHLQIEIKKRTKEALISKLPLNSMMISINQHLYLLHIAKQKEPKLCEELKISIRQQVMLARVEAVRLLNYYSIMLGNKELLGDDWKHEIPIEYNKVKSVQLAIQKLNEYEHILKNEAE